MIEIISQNEDEKNFIKRGAELQALRANPEKGVNEKVRSIMGKILNSDNMDAAVFSLVKEFDQVEINSSNVKVSEAEMKAAYKEVSAGSIKIIKEAAKSIRAFHVKQKKTQSKLKGKKSILALREVPVERVGVYVPGGKTAYPSTVLMNIIPAQIAGVKKIVMATPVGAKTGGKIAPILLVAANEAAQSGKASVEIYKIGGAQAIAALAFGTQSIPQVDLIVGPGNAYVTAAKQMLSGLVGIDKMAGPSDVVILADKSANPTWIAADMKSQMEHDANASAILVTADCALAEKVQEELPETTKTSAIMVTKNLDEAIKVVNRLAPEHLEVLLKSPTSVLDKIENAGAIFLGEYTPVAMGDYGVGPNHVLPTGGTARFDSVLTVADFMKRQSVMMLSKEQFKKKALMVETFASLENFSAHANSVSIRAKNL